MKLLLRYLFITLCPGLILFYLRYSNPPVQITHKYDTRETVGIYVDPWRVRSLQEIDERERAEFAKLYDDDRRSFGYGKANSEPLRKDTVPLKFPHHSQIKKVLLDKVAHSDSMRNARNMKKLILAAEKIKQQIGVSSSTLRTILELRKTMMSDIPFIDKYNNRFLLTRKEIHTLQYAKPYRMDTARENRRKRDNRDDLLDFVIDEKHRK